MDEAVRAVGLVVAFVKGEPMAHGRDKHRSRENRRILRDFLMREWDPIGVAGIPEAHDEYDRYVGEVYAMLVDGNPTAPDMLQYLEDVELDYRQARAKGAP
jgi:hypothetical protein